MKKTLVVSLALLLALTLAACGGGDGGKSDTQTAPPASSSSTATPGGSAPESQPANTDGGETSEMGGKLNPPDWLVGTWKGDEVTNGELIEVTENNVTVSSGNLDFSWQMENVGLEVTETEEGGVYHLEYPINGVMMIYTFTQESDGTMTRGVGMDENALVTSIFTKQ